MFYYYLLAGSLFGAACLSSAYYYRGPIASKVRLWQAPLKTQFFKFQVGLKNMWQASTLYCWEKLMGFMHHSSSVSHLMAPMKILLKLNPSLINHRMDLMRTFDATSKDDPSKTIKKDIIFKQISPLEIILSKQSISYDHIHFLIDSGANINFLNGKDYFHISARFMEDFEETPQMKDFTSNLMYFLREHLIVADQTSEKSYKEHLKGYISVLEKICDKFGANYRLNNKVSLFSYIYGKSWEMSQAIIDKGGDPLYTAHPEEYTAFDYLFETCSHDEYDAFLERGFIPKINIYKTKKTDNYIYILNTPVLREQVSLSEQCDMVCLLTKLFSYPSRKFLFYLKGAFKDGYEWLEDVTLNLALSSEENAKKLASGNALSYFNSRFHIHPMIEKIRKYWLDKNKSFARDISEMGTVDDKCPWKLEEWQCLPKGLKPRIDNEFLSSTSYIDNRNYAAKVLDIKPDATRKEILVAYKKASLKYHPDKNIGPWKIFANEEFVGLQKAKDLMLSAAR